MSGKNIPDNKTRTKSALVSLSEEIGDTPMIMCVHQRGGMTYFDVHNTKQSLISNIRRLINCHHHTKVYTDEYLAYENLKKYGFVHKQVCHSQKEYARGEVHFKTIPLTCSTKNILRNAFAQRMALYEDYADFAIARPTLAVNGLRRTCKCYKEYWHLVVRRLLKCIGKALCVL